MGDSKGSMRIKPFKSPVRFDADHVTTSWNKLRNAIQQIQLHNESELSFEDLYRTGYNLVLHKYGDMLYAGLVEVVSSHMQALAEEVEKSIHNNFLATLIEKWDDHLTSMLMIRDILLYMDRKYVPHKKLDSVFNLGLIRFRDDVLRRKKIHDHLGVTLQVLITKDRKGELVERQLIRSTCKMLVDVGVDNPSDPRAVYVTDFEKPFLIETAKFYHMEAEDNLLEANASLYLRNAERRLEEEDNRVSHYLDEGSRDLVLHCVEQELLSDRMTEVLEMEGSGLLKMIELDKLEDLTRVFLLFKRVKGGLHLVCRMLKDYLQTTGSKLVTKESKEKGSKPAIKFVQTLLNLRDKYVKILKQSFNNELLFRQAVNDAFKHFVNLQPRAPEYVSLFIDDTLKRGMKDITEEEFDTILGNTILLFRFLEDKDIFERYFKQHLAKRLLTNKSQSEDAELSVISRLKAECGYYFTSKLEGMFKDIRVSKDTNEKFGAFLRSETISLGYELNVRVLTTVHWPSNPPVSATFPQSLQRGCEAYEKFYDKSHTGRKLRWLPNFGSGEISATFPKSKHTLIVSTTQLIVIMMFSALADDATIPYTRLLSETKLPEPDLKRTLQSLACGKCRILVKSPPGKEIGQDDTFRVNNKFTSNLFRVKIPQIVARETQQELRLSKTKIEDDRRHLIEASIVRVMKARKTLHHNNLVAEVTKQLKPRFTPSPATLKKRIEALIERDFLERSSEDRKVYNYLA